MTNVLLDLYCVCIQLAEETRVKQIKEITTKFKRWTSCRSLTDLLFTLERDHNDVSSLDMSLLGNSNRNDLDYFDDNMEMDMKVEMFVEECKKRDKGY
jgi:hypothetical protein